MRASPARSLGRQHFIRDLALYEDKNVEYMAFWQKKIKGVAF
jgi:hypothetical protein